MRILSLNDAVAIFSWLALGSGLQALGRTAARDTKAERPKAESLDPRARLLSLHPRDDFFAHVLRCGLVAIEVHRVGRAALRSRTQVGRVAEHFRERDPRGDDLRAAAILLRLNLAAAARQVAHHVAHVFLRH